MPSQLLRYKRNQDVVSRNIDGELVIVPIRSGVGDLNSLYTLNPVGCVLWEFMTESHTVPEMVQRVCNEFEVTQAQAQPDIESFLESMLAEQLVKPVA